MLARLQALILEFEVQLTSCVSLGPIQGALLLVPNQKPLNLLARPSGPMEAQRPRKFASFSKITQSLDLGLAPRADITVATFVAATVAVGCGGHRCYSSREYLPGESCSGAAGSDRPSMGRCSVSAG